jgi:hypothetical protein
MYGQGSIAIFLRGKTKVEKLPLTSPIASEIRPHLHQSPSSFGFQPFPELKSIELGLHLYQKMPNFFCILKLASKDSEQWLSCGRQNLAECGGCEDKTTKRSGCSTVGASADANTRAQITYYSKAASRGRNCILSVDV